jgi:RNA polymerase sigma-70 factor, ECF subfamily
VTAADMAAPALKPQRDDDLDGADEARLNASFTAFCEENLSRVRHFLLSYCRESSLVDDAVQEAFLAARSRWAEIRHFDRPVAWVYKAAVYKERKLRHRRDNRESIGLDDLPPERLVAPADGHEARLLLQQALRQLPASWARITRLDIDGWNAAEIAEILGLTVNTVQTYKRRARQRLRELIATIEPATRQPGGQDGA